MHRRCCFEQLGAEREVSRTHKIAMFNILVALSVAVQFYGNCECCACQTEYFRIKILHFEMLKLVDSYLFTLWFCLMLLDWLVGWLKDINLNILYDTQLNCNGFEMHIIIFWVRDEFRFWWDNRNPSCWIYFSLRKRLNMQMP